MHSKKLFTFFLAAAFGIAGCKKDNDNATTVLISTSNITNINSPSATAPVTATSGGDIEVVGTESITERGLVWGKVAKPTTSDSKMASGTGKGNFVANLAGLTFGTTYYVRAYVINNGQTFYGNEVKFIASAPIPLIANGDLETADAAAGLTNALNWKTDETDGGIMGRASDGRNATNFIWTYNSAKSFYQLTGKVPSAASDYAISFDGNYDWTDWGSFNAELGVIFSAYNGNDPTTRVVIDTVKIATGDFPGWGNNWTRKTASFSIPAGSAFAGQNLVIEFDVLPYVDPSNGDVWDNTVWYQFDNISVIQTIK